MTALAHDTWLIIGPPIPGGRGGSDHRVILTGRYNRAGDGYTVRQQYSGRLLARSNGGGYDRAHTALADAIQRLWGLSEPCDGGAGEYHVNGWANRHGITIYTLTEALYNLPRR